MAASSKSMTKKKRKLEDMSMDEFMLGEFDSDSDSDGPISKMNSKKLLEKKDNKKAKKKKKGNLMEKEITKNQKEDTLKTNETGQATTKKKKIEKKPESKLNKKSDQKQKPGSHKKSLQSLKEKDPEFYEFLQQEDQGLLNFEESDDDESEEELDDIQDSDDEENDDENFDDIPTSSDEEDVHKPPKKLEEASEGSSSEEDETEAMDEGTSTKQKSKKDKGSLVTAKMIKEWSEAVQKSASPNVLKEMISAFRAAVHQAGSETETSKYRVEGSAVYNSVIRMCLTLIAPALLKHLGLPPLTDLQKPTLPSKNNAKWKKIRLDVKSYLTAVLELLTQITETSMVNVIVKHLFKLVAYVVSFPKLSKTLMKKMVSLWSTGEETTRVVAFLCINRQVTISQDSMLEPSIKQMYIAYVKNCKFTSPTTLPMINFMQRSLVEIFTIDQVLGYQYAFIYIRQLAIHLRNAITVKKKENVQAVYNWQYIHCCELWVRLLSATYPSDVLQPLIYPLTQTIIGTLKLTPTARYFPLRFHCVRMMNTLSESTDTFIPVLPFLLEVFELTDFNKKHKSISFKPFNFACILKLSKAQLVEKSFKDGIIDQLYELFMDQLHIHAHKIGFPELVLPTVLQLKEFLKKCKIANYCKQMKQVLDKIQESAKFITDRRKSVSFNIADDQAITAWETQCKNSGTPLGKYYTTWRKLRDRELQYQIAAKEQGLSKAEEEIPTIQRPKGIQKATTEEKKEFSALFEPDSDDSDDDDNRFLPKKERPAKGKEEEESDYSDFDSDELEQLAKSASEDDDDEEMEEDSAMDNSDIEGEEENMSDDEDDLSDDGVEGDDLSDDGVEGDDLSDGGDDKDDIVEDFSLSDSD